MLKTGRLPMGVFILTILLMTSLQVTFAIAADPIDNMPMAGTQITKGQATQGTGWGTPQSSGTMGPMMGIGGMMGRGMMGRGGMMGWGMQPSGMSPMMGCGMIGHGIGMMPWGAGYVCRAASTDFTLFVP